MKQVAEKTFKAYAKETERELNTLEITATAVFTYYGVSFSLYRDECNVGYVTVWYDGYTSGTDETTGEMFRIPPFQPTMKSLFKAVYETVNYMLKGNCFKLKESVKQEIRPLTVTLHPEDEEEEKTITYEDAKGFHHAVGQEALEIEKSTDGISIDKDHVYIVIEFLDGSEATFMRSSVVRIAEGEHVLLERDPESAMEKPKQYFSVTFERDGIYSVNIAHAAKKSDVEAHYSKYNKCLIREANEYEVEEAKRRHMPIIKL